MSHRGRDDRSADDRALADGGTDVARTGYANVAEGTSGGSATDVPRLGGGQHLFAPAELPPWALSVPFAGALAVAVGAQGSTVLATGGGSAWLGTVVAAIGLLVVLSLAFRAA